MRANRMPRAIERAWLLKGVTETGSAPQVPQDIDEFIFPSPLFHPFVISLTPPFSPPPLVFIPSFFPLSSTRKISQHSFFSNLSPFDSFRRSIVKNLSRSPHASISLRIFEFDPRRSGSKKKGKKGREREREREGEGGDHGNRKRLSRNDLAGKGV